MTDEIKSTDTETAESTEQTPVAETAASEPSETATIPVDDAGNVASGAGAASISPEVVESARNAAAEQAAQQADNQTREEVEEPAEEPEENLIEIARDRIVALLISARNHLKSIPEDVARNAHAPRLARRAAGAKPRIL